MTHSTRRPHHTAHTHACIIGQACANFAGFLGDVHVVAGRKRCAHHNTHTMTLPRSTPSSHDDNDEDVDDGHYEGDEFISTPLLSTHNSDSHDGGHAARSSRDGARRRHGAHAHTRSDSVFGQLSHLWTSSVPARVTEVLRVVAVGQVISALVCSTGVFSKLLVLRGVSVPCSQSLLTYLMLAVVYLPVLARRGTLVGALRRHWAFFLFAALADVEVCLHVRFSLFFAFCFFTICLRVLRPRLALHTTHKMCSF